MPGRSAMQRKRGDAWSEAIARVSISSAAFDMQYTALPGMTVCAAPEEILMILRSSRSSKRLRNRPASASGAVTLIAYAA
jgi:hypothetical protein